MPPGRSPSNVQQCWWSGSVFADGGGRGHGGGDGQGLVAAMGIDRRGAVSDRFLGMVPRLPAVWDQHMRVWE